MNDLRTAAQQALEALKKNTKHLPLDFDYHFEALAALRAALAEPVQELVAWIYADPDKPGLKFLEWREDAFGYEGEWTKTPLYTAPSQHKPLTDGEIREMFFAELRALPPYPSAIEELPERFARAIERAHGIVPSDCPDSHQPGCDRCRSPLWAGIKCDVCGRKA